jgi:hypothetical protein
MAPQVAGTGADFAALRERVNSLVRGHLEEAVRAETVYRAARVRAGGGAGRG